MSGVQIESSKVSGLWTHGIKDLSFINMLKEYHELLKSTFGPQGCLVLINNSAGKEILTASSVKIINHVAFQHPCLKYINALISAQNESFGLHGLYVGILCSGLLLYAIKCNETIPFSIISEVSELIITEFLSVMEESSSNIVMKLDLENIESMLSIVKTIFNSKKQDYLSVREVNHLCLQVVKAFIRSVPQCNTNAGFGYIHIITEKESSCLQAKVYNGLLYREPDLDDSNTYITKKDVRVLLFTVPLGCSEDIRKNNQLMFTKNGEKKISFTNSLFNILSKCFKKNNVQLIACQKVIEPELKHRLEKEGFLLLERLGSVLSEGLVELSGCVGVANINGISEATELSSSIGFLTSVDLVVVSNKSYLLLEHSATTAVTLFIPGVPEHSHTRELCESSLKGLRGVCMEDGRAVVGGGCLETWMITHLNRIMIDRSQLWASTLDVSHQYVTQVCLAFIAVWRDIAVQLSGGSNATPADCFTDSVCHHLWNNIPLAKENSPTQYPDALRSQISRKETVTTHCKCGMVHSDQVTRSQGTWEHLSIVSKLFERKKIEEERLLSNSKVAESDLKEVILDCFSAKLNASRIAFEGFMQLINISQFIFDK